MSLYMSGGKVVKRGAGMLSRAASLPAWLSGMADFEIKRFASASNAKPNLEDVYPSDWVSSGFNRHKVIGVYSGGAANSGSGRLYCSGGGHNDCDSNGVFMMDFSGAPVGWSLLSISNHTDVQDAETYADGKPASAHTYSGQCYDSVTNKMYRFHGSRWNSGSTPSDNRAFNLATNTWANIATWTDTNPSTTVVDETQRKILVLNHSGNYKFYRIDANTLSAGGTVSQQSFDSVSAYDPTRSRALVHASDQLWRLDIDWSGESCTLTSISSTGVDLTTLGRAPGIFYDALKDRFWMVPITGDTHSGCATIYEIHPTTWAVTSHATSGATSGYTTALDYTGMYNDLVWVPTWRAVCFVVGTTDASYGVKLPA